jgi:hypothetical protein
MFAAPEKRAAASDQISWRLIVTATDTNPEVEYAPSARRGMILITVFLAVVMAAGVATIYYFSANERAR